MLTTDRKNIHKINGFHIKPDFIQSLPEIAARAKCEKLRVVKTVPLGKPLARFSKE